jgi:hypothetical protein
MKSLILSLFFIVIEMLSFGQIQESFSDGNFTLNPQWIGQDSLFTIIDEQGNSKLQSSSLIPNTSFYLATANNLSLACKWEFTLMLDFNTSSANYVDFFLTADQADLNAPSTSGYYLRVGETLDEISLYRKQGSSRIKIIDGPDGMSNQASNMFRIQITRNMYGTWRLFVDETTTGQAFDYIGSVNDLTMTSSAYSGWSIMQSTSTFMQKHRLDDVSIEVLPVDSIAPEISMVRTLSSTELELTFSEFLDSTSAIVASNYLLMPGNTIQHADFYNDLKKVRVVLSNPLENGHHYQLQYAGMRDLDQNITTTQHVGFTCMFPEQAAPNDIIINEILFNPVADGCDWIELYNASNKYIDLSSLLVAKNEQGSIGSLSAISSDRLLEPGQWIVVGSDTSWIQATYPMHGNLFVQNNLPSLNNDSSTIYLLTNNMVIDRLSYQEDWHFDLLQDVEGVSLERISLENTIIPEQNWHSAASSMGSGTPGTQNSVYTQQPVPVLFSCSNTAISPDNDGVEDVMLFQYELEQPGYVATLTIYTDLGQEICTILNNELVGTQGVVSWDGLTTDQTKAHLGLYVAVFSGFHPTDKKLFRKTAVISVNAKL